MVIIKFGSRQALETERYERPLNRLTVNFRVRRTHLRSWRNLTLPDPTRRESSTREPRQTSELVNLVLNLCSIKESLWYFVADSQTGFLWLEIGKFEHFWRKQFIKNISPVICLHLFLHKFSYGIKNSSCLLQCPLIPEFSPNSRMLSFEARMLMLSFYSPTV